MPVPLTISGSKLRSGRCISNETAKMLASVGNESSFIKFDYLNSNMSYYGIRRMQVTTSLLPNDYIPSDSDKDKQAQSNSVKSGNWIEARRDLLAKINKDNVVFENGNMRLRGNERIKAGMQLELARRRGWREIVSLHYPSRS